MSGKRFCPNCGSDNVEFMGGGITGSFMCSDCDYMGSVFPERTANKDLDDEMDEEEVVVKPKKVKKVKSVKSTKPKKKAGKKK